MEWSSYAGGLALTGFFVVQLAQGEVDRREGLEEFAALSQQATGSAPPSIRDPMIRSTPKSPAPSPATPTTGSRSPKTSQDESATRSGIVEAMMAASDASIVCIATKFSPR